MQITDVRLRKVNSENRIPSFTVNLISNNI